MIKRQECVNIGSSGVSLMIDSFSGFCHAMAHAKGNEQFNGNSTSSPSHDGREKPVIFLCRFVALSEILVEYLVYFIKDNGKA